MNYKNNVLKVNGSEIMSLYDLLKEFGLKNTDLFQEIEMNVINYPYILDSKSKIEINWNEGNVKYYPSKYGCKYDRKTNK